MFTAVWGVGLPAVEIGVIGTFATREAAEQAARTWLKTQFSLAVRAWVRPAA